MFIEQERKTFIYESIKLKIVTCDENLLHSKKILSRKSREILFYLINLFIYLTIEFKRMKIILKSEKIAYLF